MRSGAFQIRVHRVSPFFFFSVRKSDPFQSKQTILLGLHWCSAAVPTLSSLSAPRRSSADHCARADKYACGAYTQPRVGCGSAFEQSDSTSSNKTTPHGLRLWQRTFLTCNRFPTTSWKVAVKSVGVEDTLSSSASIKPPRNGQIASHVAAGRCRRGVGHRVHASTRVQAAHCLHPAG